MNLQGIHCTVPRPVPFQAPASLPHIYPLPPLVHPSFLGLKIPIPQLLYRVCRDDEDVNSDIMCKDPSLLPITSQTPLTEAKKAVNLHIHSGHIPTQFISCTGSEYVARKWAFYYKKQLRPIPQNIIIIDTTRIPAEIENLMIDLRDVHVRHYFLSGKPQLDFAKGADEVLFQLRIPKKILTQKTNDGLTFWTDQENVFDLWDNPPMPLQPK